MNDRELVLGNLCLAVQKLETSQNFAKIIPQVRTNIAYCLSNAVNPHDVAAIEGRITVINGLPKASGYPGFGASDHLARKLLEVRKFDSLYRAIINFAFTKELDMFLKQWCSQLNIRYGGIDRRKEPPEVSEIDGASMPWKVAEAVKLGGGKVPEVFYEAYGLGKEDLTVWLGISATDVVEKVTTMTDAFAAKK